MCNDEHEIKALLESAEMNTLPNNDKVDAVREHTVNLAGRHGGGRNLRIGILVVAAVVLCASGFGIAATDTGRRFVRWIFLPVTNLSTVEWEDDEGSSWTHSRNSGQEFTEAEEQEAVDEMREMGALKKAGAGRLTGIFELPSGTTYYVEYTLSDGRQLPLGQGRPEGLQAENMRINEIEKLLADGAGEVIQHHEAPIGMGFYTIRFTLADGETADVMTYYPPGPRSERDAIFAETRQLRANLDFELFNPANNGEAVWAMLQYTLADGRKVGIVEEVPPEVMSEDGTQVILPRSDWPEDEAVPAETEPTAAGD